MAFLDPLVNLPKPQKVIIGALGLVVVGAVAYFFVISPRTMERDGLSQQNEALRAEVIKARADEANLREFRLQVAALRKRLDAAKERLPVEKEIPRLYRTLSDLAFQAGLNLALFQPRPPDERGVLSEVPITVTAETGYHQLGTFFDRVGRLPRLVTLGDFRISAITQPTGTVRAELTMATYIYKGDTAPPSPTPARPGATPPAGARR